MANLGPKKDGSPNIDFFQSTESLQGFEAVRLWLQKTNKKVNFRSSDIFWNLIVKIVYLLLIIYFQYVQTDPPTKEFLSQLIIQFIQYQDTKLGKNAVDPIATRLPVKFRIKYSQSELR